jgi:spore maturation protein CgeB
MRILVFGRVYPDSFADNILTTLRAMRHDAHIVQHFITKPSSSAFFTRMIFYLRRFLPSVDQSLYHKAVQQVAWFQPDLILVPGEQPPPEVITAFRQRTRSRVVQWFPDGITSLGRQHILGSPYHAYFLVDNYTCQFLRDKLGKRAYLLPQACNPRWHHRVSISKSDQLYYGCDIAVAGNLYWYRALILEQLLDYDIKIWGPQVPVWLRSPVAQFHQQQYVARLEKAKAFNAAKIVLNTKNIGAVDALNLRLFEVAGCGGFQITEWKPILSDYFQPEEEIVTYCTLGELRTKIQYYLSHEHERQRIAHRSYRRVQNEHTYVHRLQQLLKLTFAE